MKKYYIAIVLLILSNLSIANDFINEVTDLVGNKPEININLSTGIINTIVALSDDEDAKEAQKILSGLNKLKVSVFELGKNSNHVELTNLIKNKIQNLTNQGFEQIVTVRDGDEIVNIVAKIENEYLQDVMIIVMEENDELVIVSMDGEVNMQQLAQISDRFDIDFDDIVNM